MSSQQERFDRMRKIINTVAAEMGSFVEDPAVADAIAKYEARVSELETLFNRLDGKIDSFRQLKIDVQQALASVSSGEQVISGGQTSYMVDHQLGYYPVVSIIDSSNTFVDIMVSHIDDNAFVVSGVGLSFTGTIIYF